MRSFLPDIKIYGAVLMSRTGDVAHYCLQSLLKYCDKILIVLDNENDRTRDIVQRYAARYKEISYIDSPIPGTTKEQEEEDRMCIYNRFKSNQGIIREEVLKELRKRYDTGEKIDLLVWLDHDECLSINFPKVLENFWNSSYKELAMKGVDVFVDFNTIHNQGQTCHGRIWKFDTTLTANPHRWGCHLLPIGHEERMGDRYTLVHLSLLGKEMIDWRQKHWNRSGKPIDMAMPLWKVGKDVRKCTPQEIEEILKRPPDLNVYEYLRGGDKRMPVGKENAIKALRDTSDMLDEMGIRHYLAFGTCLGIVRDGSLLPWDWDNDFIIDGKDLGKFKPELLKKYEFSDYKIKKDIPRWKKEDGTKSDEYYVRTISFKKYNVRNDLDPIWESEDGKNGVILKGRKREYLSAIHPLLWFQNAKEIEYHGKKYLVPNPVEEYLKSNYGDLWGKPTYGPMDWHERPCMKQFYACKKI